MKYALMAGLALGWLGTAGASAGERMPDAPVRALPEEERRIDLKHFTLTFNDEFDGDELNREVWTTPHHERQGASRWRSQYARVGDGKLWIDVELTDDLVYRYNSAGLRTSKTYKFDEAQFAQTYGYWEVKARLFKRLDADYWAAFWLLSGDVYKEEDADTRQGVEIDIMESFRFYNEGQSGHNLHWGSYGKFHNAGGPKSGLHPQLTDGEMHTYGLYWDEDMYAFCVDGAVVAVTDAVGWGADAAEKNPALTASRGTSRRPAIAKISVEAAPWAGPSHLWEKELPKKDVFEVDYIRVYQGRLPDAMKKKLLEYNQPTPHAAVAAVGK